MHSNLNAQSISNKVRTDVRITYMYTISAPSDKCLINQHNHWPPKTGGQKVSLVIMVITRSTVLTSHIVTFELSELTWLASSKCSLV